MYTHTHYIHDMYTHLTHTHTHIKYLHVHTYHVHIHVHTMLHFHMAGTTVESPQKGIRDYFIHVQCMPLYHNYYTVGIYMT